MRKLLIGYISGILIGFIVGALYQVSEDRELAVKSGHAEYKSDGTIRFINLDER